MADSYDVAVMHDFFVDRLVHVRSLSDLLAQTKTKARQGGGSVHGIMQEDVKGGNAVNLAHALALLGARVLLITHSDREHLPLLRGAFKGLRAEVKVKPLPPGLTVAFEERVNVMVSHSGGAERFAPSLLTGEDWDRLRRSKVVASVNWAANQRGTELLLALRKRLGAGSLLFLNPSDVRDRFKEYGSLVRMLQTRRLANWISLNEFEAAATAKALRLRTRITGSLCSSLSKSFGARVDIHTDTFSLTSSGGPSTGRRIRRVSPRRLTGAGDVWDAASLFAFLKGMDGARRLEFANAAAGLYVAGDVRGPPKLDEVKAALG